MAQDNKQDQDFDPQEAESEAPVDIKFLSQNVMARDKVLYEGHVVAAVAATTPRAAKAGVEAIEVTYEVLPHVLDVDQARADGAPILHDTLFTSGVEPKPEAPSNVASKATFERGDLDAGFAEADVIIEREFNTRPVHQAYIEPHACVASVSEDGQAELWCTTQGHFVVRAHCARLLDMDISQIRVTYASGRRPPRREAAPRSRPRTQSPCSTCRACLAPVPAPPSPSRCCSSARRRR